MSDENIRVEEVSRATITMNDRPTLARNANVCIGNQSSIKIIPGSLGKVYIALCVNSAFSVRCRSTSTIVYIVYAPHSLAYSFRLIFSIVLRL